MLAQVIMNHLFGSLPGRPVASASKSLVRHLSAATPSLRLRVIPKSSSAHLGRVKNSWPLSLMSPTSVRPKRG